MNSYNSNFRIIQARLNSNYFYSISFEQKLTHLGCIYLELSPSVGVGKETAMELACRKARVILACRNMNRASRAAQEIFDETGQPVVIKHLDLSSLASVRRFADDIIKTEARLDVLINNAGSVNGEEPKLIPPGSSIFGYSPPRSQGFSEK